MAFALHFRSHPWHPISTAPCNRGVELRVREGTAISTLEFPCQQTNAGDWINCDFGTPIKIEPVEWRAWQHEHSPQPQSPKINTRGRLALPRRDHRSAKRPSPGEMKLLDRPVRRRKTLATMAYALIGIVVMATVVGSLTRISAWALPIGSTAPMPSSVAEVSIAAQSSLRTEDSCKGFDSVFLNSACATPHKRFAIRRIHRVATFVVGRSDAQQ
jgi:hypothetical protein